MMLVERKACFQHDNAFLSRLGLDVIWPISGLEIAKMSKKCVFGQKLQESIG